MSFYKDFLALGFSESEALELAYIAENVRDDHVADIELGEATQILIDKFNEVGCTSFRMSAGEIAKIMKG